MDCSESDEVPQGEGATQSSVDSSIYANDPQHNQWGVVGMKVIYWQGLEPKGQ